MEQSMEIWMKALTQTLQTAFGERLLFTGLQGSRRRGEAKTGSDIDVVVILDTLDLADLAQYRTLLTQMEEGALVCGFVGGREELLGWPRHELFQFMRDTKAYYGALADLLPPVGWEDVLAAVQVGAGSLYHSVCHSYLFSQNPGESLGELKKGAYFLLLALQYLRTGTYCQTKEELAETLGGEERALLLPDETPLTPAQVEGGYRLLLSWSSYLLKGRGLTLWLRPYREEDLPTLLQLFHETVHTVAAKDYSPAQLAAWAPGVERMDQARWNSTLLAHHSLMAIWEGRVAGFADMDETGYLDRLYVHKDCQGRGVATFLVEALEAQALRQGLTTYTTHASKTARPFFEKHGYQVVKEQTVERLGTTLVNYLMEKSIEI